MKKCGAYIFIFTFFCLASFASLSGISKQKAFAIQIVTPDITQTEYVNYSRREIDESFFIMPSYTSYISTKACGPVSGATICGYYDYFYPNVVPNFVTYSIVNGIIHFYSSDPKIDRLISNLMTAMSMGSNGVTVAQYKSGLSDYFYLFAGLNTTYTSVMTGGSINFAACKDEINAGRPIALFLSYYNDTYYGTPQTGQDRVTSEIFINNHIMTACGYKIVKYYRMENGQEVLFRTVNYLWVETGWEYAAYMDIGRNMVLYDAYSVKVA